jgi:GDPmannose 4,6-dehydratase
MNIEWSGSGLDEVGINSKTGKIVVEVSPQFFRPVETTTLRADCSLAKKELGWEPEYSFDYLVQDMCHFESKEN